MFETDKSTGKEKEDSFYGTKEWQCFWTCVQKNLKNHERTKRMSLSAHPCTKKNPKNMKYQLVYIKESWQKHGKECKLCFL